MLWAAILAFRQCSDRRATQKKRRCPARPFSLAALCGRHVGRRAPVSRIYRLLHEALPSLHANQVYCIVHAFARHAGLNQF
jgi:hypothetical protein